MCPQMPYSPIRTPQKHVSQEEMWATLAKRAKPQVQVVQPEPRLPLEWLKPVKTGERSAYIATACGMFTVSKDVSGERISYTGWSCATKPATNLGCVMTPEAAKALCEAAR